MPLRQPQPADLPESRLTPDGRNLALVLNHIVHTGGTRFDELLRRFFPRFGRMSTTVSGGTVQFYLHESGFGAPIPATRLSDGTIRFVALLATLLTPTPPPLVCIEEPELGLHPDAVALLADVLVEASDRMQLVVTTHSDALVSALSNQPEAIVACERPGPGTEFAPPRSAAARLVARGLSAGRPVAHGRTGGEPVSGVEIYMEGGGSGADTKAALRRGMDALLGPLKQAARKKSMGWKVVCCGPRDVALRSFRNAARNAGAAIVLLLVDAEGPVSMEPGAHLKARDGWDMADVGAGSVHLMVQTMEAWIVADVDALDRYYGQGFRAGLLPKGADLESVAKSEIERSLHRATEHTSKRRYHKIKHASDLLQRVDAEEVKARCHHCRRLFDELGRMIDESQGKAAAR